MKRFHLKNLIFVFSVIFFAISSANAQFQNQPQEVSAQQMPRPNLMRELNLSNDQIRQIRRLNQERRPIMQEAQRRLREANRALDEAIYAEIVDEAEIQRRLKEAQAAQAEMIRNRTLTEQQVRQILTPEQLSRFRSLRAQYMEPNNSKNRPPNRRQRLQNLRRGMPAKPPGNRPPRQP